MIGETGERKSAVATPDGKSRKKKKKTFLAFLSHSDHICFVSTSELWYLLQLRAVR